MFLFLRFFKLVKELDGDKVESWAKGLSDRWINNDDLKRKGIQKHSQPDLLAPVCGFLKRTVFKLCMISNVYHIPLEEIIDHNGETLSQEDFHLIGRAMLEVKMYYEAAQVSNSLLVSISF